jgi:hypothetical protein
VNAQASGRTVATHPESPIRGEACAGVGTRSDVSDRAARRQLCSIAVIDGGVPEQLSK